jgi:hypothetical protein
MLWMTAGVATIATVLGQIADAAPEPKLPKITGGGVAQNFNSVSPFGTVELETTLGFNAQATEEGVVVPFDPFGVDALDYPAKGQIQMKNTLADDPSVTVSQLHGEVVCIANLGPAGLIDGDDPNDDDVADPLGDVWEIRFEIVRASADGEDIELPPFPIYGSIYVQDGGKNDFVDESFAAENLAEPDCVLNPFFGLEPLLNGNITVHE